MRVGVQSHAPTALPPGERLGTHCAGGWMGPKVRSGRLRKISPQPGFDPRTVRPIASCYTNYAIPTLDIN